MSKHHAYFHQWLSTRANIWPVLKAPIATAFVCFVCQNVLEASSSNNVDPDPTQTKKKQSDMGSICLPLC